MPQIFEGSEARIAYEQSGAGDDLVWVGGGGTLGRDWRRFQTDFFDPHYRSTTFDNRGIGDTVCGAPGPWPIESFARDVAELIEAVCTPPVRIVGSSLGSAIVQQVAIDRPDLLRCAVVMGTGAWSTGWGWDYQEAEIEFVKAGGALTGLMGATHYAAFMYPARALGDRELWPKLRAMLMEWIDSGENEKSLVPQWDASLRFDQREALTKRDAADARARLRRGRAGATPGWARARRDDPGRRVSPDDGHGPLIVVRSCARRNQSVHPRADWTPPMIDCDVHVQIGDREEFLSFIEPSQRPWFRDQGPLLALPGYTWGHPTGFMRSELELSDHGVPGCNADLVRREVLDPYDVEIGLLTADDGDSACRSCASAYRAAEYARAHNNWMRDCWLDADPRFRGTIIVPAQDPRAAAAEISRAAEDPPVRRRAPLRGIGGALRRAAVPTDLRGGRRLRPARCDPLG